MKHSTGLLTIFLLAITACTTLPGGSTQNPVITAGPRETDTSFSFPPTLAPTPIVSIKKATLYSGPGNLNYESLGELPIGATVYPSGTYGGFVKVDAVVPSDNSNTVTGFIWSQSLPAESLFGLPVLTRDQVPWEPFFLPACSPERYDPKTGTVTIAGDSEHEGYYPRSAVWAVEAPIRVQIGALKASGGTWGNGWSNIILTGSAEMRIRSREEDGNYEIDLYRLGVGDAVKKIPLNRASSQPIQILFDQPEGSRPIGTSFSVLDEAGRVLESVTQTDLSNVHLPDGLFANGRLFFGFEALDGTTLEVTGLSIGSQPAGKWVERADTEPGLFQLAGERNLAFGSDFLLDRAIDRRYCQTMQHDFNVAVLSNFSWNWFWGDEPGNTTGTAWIARWNMPPNKAGRCAPPTWSGVLRNLSRTGFSTAFSQGMTTSLF
jgi:hypothetical protein